MSSDDLGIHKSLKIWSVRPGSNRRHSAWEADVLPLNYSRNLFALNSLRCSQESVQHHARAVSAWHVRKVPRSQGFARDFCFIIRRRTANVNSEIRHQSRWGK